MPAIGPNRNTLPARLKSGGLSPVEALVMMRIVDDTALGLGASNVMKVLIDNANKKIMTGAYIAFLGVDELARRAKVSKGKLSRIFQDELDPRYIRRHYLTADYQVTEQSLNAMKRQNRRCYEIVQEPFIEIGILTTGERLERQRAESASRGTKAPPKRSESRVPPSNTETQPSRVQNEGKAVSKNEPEPCPKSSESRVRLSNSNVLSENGLTDTVLTDSDAGAQEDQSDLSASTEQPTTDHALGESDLLAPSRSQLKAPSDEDRARLEASKVRPTCTQCGSSRCELVLPALAASYVCPTCRLKSSKARQRAARVAKGDRAAPSAL